jgi:hypothetical protein
VCEKSPLSRKCAIADLLINLQNQGPQHLVVQHLQEIPLDYYNE